MLGMVYQRVGLTERETEKRFANAAHYFVEGPRRPFQPFK